MLREYFQASWKVTCCIHWYLLRLVNKPNGPEVLFSRKSQISSPKSLVPPVVQLQNLAGWPCPITQNLRLQCCFFVGGGGGGCRSMLPCSFLSLKFKILKSFLGHAAQHVWVISFPTKYGTLTSPIGCSDF